MFSLLLKDLISDFILHLSEPNHIETQEKKERESNGDHWKAMHHNFGELFHLYCSATETS